MKKINLLFALILLTSVLLFTCGAFAQSTGEMVRVPAEQARIFITDSQSWELGGGTGGTDGSFGGAAGGGARPQTAEIIKTFGERCPDVTANNIKGKADYIVVLDHEGGKSFLVHRNKVAVFTRVTGDSVVSKSTYSLGASVQEACNAIRKDWAQNSDKIRSAEAAEAAGKQRAAAGTVQPTANPALTKVAVVSDPPGADIEVDGTFVGNTPSTVDVPAGDHTVSVSKNGYKNWERKLKTSGGSVNLNVQLEEQQEAQAK